MNETRQNNRPAISLSIGALVFLAAVVTFAVSKKTGLVDYPTALYAANVAMGLMLALFGNFFPKFARPLDEKLETTTRQLAADRWSGRVLVFAGLIYSALWLFAPVSSDNLKLIAPVFVLIVMAIVAANQIFVARADVLPFQQSRPRSGSDWTRGSVYIILHALAWAFATILADVIWGDQSAIWMIVAFTVTNGLLSTLVLKNQNMSEAD